MYTICTGVVHHLQQEITYGKDHQLVMVMLVLLGVARQCIIDLMQMVFVLVQIIHECLVVHQMNGVIMQVKFVKSLTVTKLIILHIMYAKVEHGSLNMILSNKYIILQWCN